MANYDNAYNNTQRHEGGYAHLKQDKGGETYAGISRKYWGSWAGWKVLDKIPNKRHGGNYNTPHLKKLIYDFYYQNFWKKIKGDYINSQAKANFLFDTAVHSGVRKAVQQLQKELGVSADGVIGPITLKSLNEASASTMENAVQGRKKWLTSLGQKSFQKGWMNRINSFVGTFGDTVSGMGQSIVKK